MASADAPFPVNLAAPPIGRDIPATLTPVSLNRIR